MSLFIQKTVKNKLLELSPEKEKQPQNQWDPEVLEIYISESYDRLADIEENLLISETSQLDSERKASLDACFRHFHTLKGNANIMSLTPLEHLMHAAESFIEGIQTESSTVRTDQYQLLFKTVDTFRCALTKLSSNKLLDPEGFQDIQHQLHNTLGRPEAEQVDESERAELSLDATNADKSLSKPTESANNEDISISELEAISPRVQKKSIRVGLGKLDQLVDMVGELVTISNMISHHATLQGIDQQNSSEALNQIASSIHDITMSMHMVPFADFFQQIPRFVRDTARVLGKKVNLTMSGEQLEIDKSLLELINDPILHIIRNAVDHGLESTEERQVTGKPVSGNIYLEASQMGSEIWISIRDDGKGLDRDRLMIKAQELGIIDQDDMPSDETLWKVILESGFSTAKEVSLLSGRGVGMEVVKQNIDKLSGNIDIKSEKGQGTTFILRFPLTLAIVETLLVKIADTCFLIPFSQVTECVGLSAENTENSQGGLLLHLHNKSIPCIRLRYQFGIEGDLPKYEKIVIIEHNQQKLGFVVDDTLDKHQTVIKSLGKLYSNYKSFSGAAILGDGTVSLILDIGNIVKHWKRK